MVQITPSEYERYQIGVRSLCELVRLGDVPRLTLKEAHTSRSLDFRNIIGFGFGVKTVKGVPQDELAICGYVVRKAPAEAVEPRSMIDYLVSTTPGLGPDVRTDVVEVGRPRAFAEYKRKIPGGASVWNRNYNRREYGTLGGWLQDARDEDDIYLLSCWHAIDGEQRHHSNQLTPPGAPIIKHENKDIADLIASINPELDKKTNRPTVDAALAKLAYGAKEGDFILQVGEICGIKDEQELKSMSVPKRVLMYGAREVNGGKKGQLSNGTVRNYSGTLVLDMSKLTSHAKMNANPPEVTFEQQLIIYPDASSSVFSEPGDSGALIMTNDNFAIGLLVGGGNEPHIGTPISIATPIYEVLERFKDKFGISVKFLTYP